MFPGPGPRTGPSQSTSNQNSTRYHHQYQHHNGRGAVRVNHHQSPPPPANFIPLQVHLNNQPPRFPIQQPTLHHHTYQHNPNPCPCPINRTKISKKAQSATEPNPFKPNDSELIKLYEEKSWDYSIGGNDLKKSEIMDLEFLTKLSEIQITPEKCDEHQFKMKKCPVTLNCCYVCHHCHFMRCVNPNCQPCLSAIASKTNHQQQQQQQRTSPCVNMNVRPNNINTSPQPQISIQLKSQQPTQISIQQNLHRPQQVFPMDNPFLYAPLTSTNLQYKIKSPTKIKANHQHQPAQQNNDKGPSLFQKTNYGSRHNPIKPSLSSTESSGFPPSPSSITSNNSQATIVSNTLSDLSPEIVPEPEKIDQGIVLELEKKVGEIINSSDSSSSSDEDEETRRRNVKMMKQRYLMMKGQVPKNENSNDNQVKNC